MVKISKKEKKKSTNQGCGKKVFHFPTTCITQTLNPKYNHNIFHHTLLVTTLIFLWLRNSGVYIILPFQFKWDFLEQIQYKGCYITCNDSNVSPTTASLLSEHSLSESSSHARKKIKLDHIEKPHVGTPTNSKAEVKPSGSSMATRLVSKDVSKWSNLLIIKSSSQLRPQACWDKEALPNY